MRRRNMQEQPKKRVPQKDNYYVSEAVTYLMDAIDKLGIERNEPAVRAYIYRNLETGKISGRKVLGRLVITRAELERIVSGE